MDLAELYNRLALGELSNLSLAEGGEIADDKRSTIVLHANEGLKKLYGRFLLKEDSLLIDDQTNDRTSYYLDSRYALSNTDEGNDRPRYINDVNKPFLDDVIKVMAVFDEHGCKLPLNDPLQTCSVYTPQPTLLQVPHPSEGVVLGVVYQASHPVLSTDVPQQEIELPEFLMGALTAFIAYKVFSHMNTQENTIKGGEHLKLYEATCIDVREQDLVTVGVFTGGLRFIRNGWT